MLRIMLLLTLSSGLCWAQQEPGGVISGRVVNAISGEPIKKAAIEIRSVGGITRDRPVGLVNAITDASGAFLAGQLPDGKYTVRATHPSYPPSRRNLTALDAIEVTIGGNRPTKDLSISLMPAGSVSGRIIGADGEPLAANVQAIEPNPAGWPQLYYTTGNTRSDENGEFRLMNLPAGRYFLLVRPTGTYPQPHALMTQADYLKQPKLNYVTTYLPNSPTIANAEPVIVTAGGSLRGVEARLSPVETYSVAGKARPPANSAVGRAFLRLIERNPDGSLNSLNNLFASATAEGEFIFNSVPKGSYTLSLSGGAQDQTFYATLPVDVSGESVTGIELPMRRALDIPFKVTLETPIANQSAGRAPDQTGAPQIYVRPLSFDLNQNFPQIKKLPDGTSELQRVTPGKYLMNVNGGYVKSIRWGDRESSGGILEANGAESGVMEVLVSKNYGEVQGSLIDYKEDSKCALALLPENEEAAVMGNFPMAALAASGKFQLQAPPGRYHALCAPGAALQQILHPGVRKWARQRATEVKVEAGATASVSIHLLSAESIEQALKEAVERNRP